MQHGGVGWQQKDATGGEGGYWSGLVLCCAQGRDILILNLNHPQTQCKPSSFKRELLNLCCSSELGEAKTFCKTSSSERLSKPSMPHVLVAVEFQKFGIATEGD